MRCWPCHDEDCIVSCPHIRVFDSSEDNTTSFDGKNWIFTETPFFDLNEYCNVEKASSFFGAIT